MVFEDVKFTWRKNEYTLPAKGMLRVIAQVEDIMPFGRLMDCVARNNVPLSKLSQCYGVMLRAAGVTVTDDEVYGALFQDGGEALPVRAMEAVGTLMQLMVPPEAVRAKGGDGVKESAAAK